MQETTIRVANQPKAISPDLFGVFFEDLNYAADGGLYGELIQNRSFAYQITEQPTWNALSFWELVTRGDGRGGWQIGSTGPIDPASPLYLVLNVHAAGGGVGVANGGFDGIAVKAGETYDFSFFARQLYMNDRWGPDAGIEGRPMPLIVRLESKEGEVLAEASVEVSGRAWTRLAGTLVPARTEDAAKFVVLAQASGGVAMDVISLFPRKTFRGRKNGLRADLAQVIAELKPKFIRFPGGCLAHGHGLNNFYRWKDTIGPVERRRGQANLCWGYHQSVGLGYYEYFQFCEDIGAKPLPVVPAAVSCQHSDHTSGIAQKCLPMDQMAAYIQDLFDLVEWANGPATSTWGAKRAEAGHPEPFGLQYLCVGNEDQISAGFKERFEMIYQAMKQRHPEITIVGTSGPFAGGEDFEEGWKFASALQVPMVDEHYYVSPDWFWENLGRYDGYDRSKSKVYLGEYAAHEPDRKSTLRSALAEAAYLTSLERNGDVVRFSSYAPLLAKRNHTQWTPDLIYFDNTTISPTVNYYVQQLFSLNAGDTYLPVTLSRGESLAEGGGGETLAVSCVRDSKSGELILKIVSRAETGVRLRIDLSAIGGVGRKATCTVLAGDPLAENAFGQAPSVLPASTAIDVAAEFFYEAPAHSLSVIRIPEAR